VKLESPRRRFQLVGAEDLDRALEDIAAAVSVGVDAERASGFRYSQRAYLLQVSTEDVIWLLDPLELDETASGWPSALAAALDDTTWILHAATQDLPNLAELEIYPSSLYDTEVAARLTGLERFGLASICSELLGLELAKEHSAADWSLRPLSTEMLNYAALDVDVLFELRVALDQRLEASGRLDWAKQEFQHLLGFKPRVKLGDPWQHLTGFHKLKRPEQQRVAAGLWLARDAEALQLDIAPGRLVPDRSLIAAALALPKSKRELAQLKDFQGRASRSKLDLWWQAIADSATLDVSVERDENGMPNHRNWQRRWPEAHERLQLARTRLIELATELGIAQENLLSPEVLRRLCWLPSDDSVAEQLRYHGAREWQISLVAEPLSAVLAQQG
jgi:ribonuclease D